MPHPTPTESAVCFLPGCTLFGSKACIFHHKIRCFKAHTGGICHFEDAMIEFSGIQDWRLYVLLTVCSPVFIGEKCHQCTFQFFTVHLRSCSRFAHAACSRFAHGFWGGLLRFFWAPKKSAPVLFPGVCMSHQRHTAFKLRSIWVLRETLEFPF